MATKVKDGWHKGNGWDIYVEDGKVLRGVDTDQNGSQITVYPYRYDGDGWTICDGISLAALRAGLNRGSIEIK